MVDSYLPDIPTGGFNFENYQRNESLVLSGYQMPKVQKTGTTICGIIFKDGVILGADTRATSGSIVADKNCEKIHYVAKNMYCCGAGTAADTEYVTRMISSQIELHRLNTGKQVPVVVANRLLKQYLFKYQGHVGAALVLGGVDKNGPSLYTIYPHGSTDRLPYVTMGSGSLAAMSVFESRWKKDMDLEEGKKLVRDAICAGIFNDLGSGSNVDICIITKDKTEYHRPYEIANLKGVRNNSYQFKRGTTEVRTAKVIPLEVESTQTFYIAADGSRKAGEKMDTSS
ncbi:Proteasome subunit beta type-7 [Tyrophagus putrescentiae]|nr:Proteasome subunit beta type-7 [Tyrophagus putrescentiae]